MLCITPGGYTEIILGIRLPPPSTTTHVIDIPKTLKSSHILAIFLLLFNSNSNSRGYFPENSEERGKITLCPSPEHALAFQSSFTSLSFLLFVFGSGCNQGISCWTGSLKSLDPDSQNYLEKVKINQRQYI